ncbi:uncharacterized protein LOC144629152 isoform X2 [Oculina patagonica]
MRGIFSFSVVAVFLFFSTRTYANQLQSNASTSKCKQHPSAGMPGIPGIPGSPGSPGRDGFKGEKGTNGKRGSAGAIGIPGKSGPRGPEGTKGEKGGKGEVGPVGAKGSKGYQGSTGIRGNTGPRGSKGSKGDAANIDLRQLANWKQCAWTEGTDTDNGKIKECSFNKLHSNTALKVSYQGTIRVYSSNSACNRWYLKFNGNECSGPLAIDSLTYINFKGELPNVHRNHFFEGYCENLARGTVTVELWVGKCSGFSTAGDALTGWNSVSRIMIEEVPPSQ